MLNTIKVLVWDFDGTLYHSTDQTRQDIRQAEFQVIQNHTGWTREKTEKEFYAVFRHKTPSGTISTALLSNIPTTQAAIECEQYIDRSKFLTRDEKLITMFEKLNNFRHFMLVNGLQKTTIASLQILGVPPTTFEEIVTSEIAGDNKPSLKGFQYILDKTKLEPREHLMIGDRDDVDLAPAKKLGMKTCLVWGKSILADSSVPTVYDVARLL